jgi:fructokinase
MEAIMDYEPRVEVAGTGLAVMDRVYLDGGLSFEALGGSCANVLVSLAMLDRQVAPLLSLGGDEVGRALVREFEAAGADTRYISRREGVASPVIVQFVDPSEGQHWFSFLCPQSRKPLPHYRPIDDEDVGVARAALDDCAVFYCDRLSASILGAMVTAREAGALVYFEPSTIEDRELFACALETATILKYSDDRLGDAIDANVLPDDLVVIATNGAAGLTVSQRRRHEWCAAIPASSVLDTCGSGDMVTVGVIDRLLGSVANSACQLEAVVQGVRAGQRLASANCQYVGARGLFLTEGAAFARAILDDSSHRPARQLPLFGA